MDGWAILSHHCSGLCSETFLGPPERVRGTQAKGGRHTDMHRAFAQSNFQRLGGGLGGLVFPSDRLLT